VPITAETSFVGEMTFRSQDSKLLDEAAKAIRELKKVSQDRELKRKEQEDIVEQPKLIEGKGAVLRDILIRPTLEGKRVPGAVIIHKNGIRYQSNTGRKLGPRPFFFFSALSTLTHSSPSQTLCTATSSTSFSNPARRRSLC